MRSQITKQNLMFLQIKLANCPRDVQPCMSLKIPALYVSDIHSASMCAYVMLAYFITFSGYFMYESSMTGIFNEQESSMTCMHGCTSLGQFASLICRNIKFC